jgi:hypothetical protein
MDRLRAAVTADLATTELHVRKEVAEQHTLALKQAAEAADRSAREQVAAAEAAAAEALRAALDEQARAAQDRLEQTAVSLEAEKARAVKLEASKWKQALKEAEKRLELEVKQARAKGVEDGRAEREHEIRLEMASFDEKKQMEQNAAITDKLKAAMDEMQRDYAGKVAALEERLQGQAAEVAAAAERALDAQVAFERQKTDAVIEAESALRARLTQEWTERLKQEVAAAVDQAAAASRHDISTHEQLSRAHERALLAQMENLVLAQVRTRHPSPLVRHVALTCLFCCRVCVCGFAGGGPRPRAGRARR